MPSNQEQRRPVEIDCHQSNREGMRQLHGQGGITDLQRQRSERAFERLLAKLDGKKSHTKIVVGLLSLCLAVMALKYEVPVAGGLPVINVDTAYAPLGR